jgi:hypothetical protein
MPAPAVKFDGALAAAHPHFGSREWSQTGRVLHWRLLRSRWPGVDIIFRGQPGSAHTNLSPIDRQKRHAPPAAATRPVMFGASFGRLTDDAIAGAHRTWHQTALRPVKWTFRS